MLVVQALKNELLLVLISDGFDETLGEGAAQQVMDMLGVRFNMDGLPPPGAKVGFRDSFHIWCFLCDPTNWEWRNILKLEGQGGLMFHATSMINHFVPESEESFEATHADLLKEFEVRCVMLILSYAYFVLVLFIFSILIIIYFHFPLIIGILDTQWKMGQILGKTNPYFCDSG